MKLLNIVIVLALACVPVQSDEVKNLRGEVAPTDESGSADVPAKESDLDKDTESEGPSDAGWGSRKRAGCHSRAG